MADQEELIRAYRLVIAHLDEQMTAAPNRQLADLSNALEEKLGELKAEEE